MEKLKLKVEEVRVESFHTVAAASGRAGTVYGQSEPSGQPTCPTRIPTCPTLEATCYCPYTGRVSCGPDCPSEDTAAESCFSCDPACG